MRRSNEPDVPASAPRPDVRACHVDRHGWL